MVVNEYINSPHDRVFRSAMSDIRVARDFFSYHLPGSIRTTVDLDTLEVCPTTYVDQTLKLSLSDVLYKVKIDKEIGYIYLLCEHQSSIDPLMPFRILQYIVSIWGDHLKKTKKNVLPLVVPMVFYHGPTPYDGPLDIRQLIKAPVALVDQFLFKPFYLIDTHDIADETLRDQHWAGILTFVMKNIYTRDLLIVAQPILEMIEKLQDQEGDEAIDFIVLLLNYILIAGEIPKPEVFVRTLEKGLPNPIRGEFMTIAERLIDMGRQEGRQKGRQEGINVGLQSGKSGIILDLLQHKYGTIPEVYQKKVEQADSETLSNLSKKLLESDSLVALFDD